MSRAARSVRFACLSLLSIACSEPPAPASNAEPAPRAVESTESEATDVSAAAASSSGSTSTVPAEAHPAEASAPGPDHLFEIADEAAWDQLAAPSNEHAVARTEVVKLLFDHVTDQLWFCHSGRWPIHYDFAVEFIQTDERPLGDRRSFNRAQYLRPDREMQMASLVHYRDAGLWTLELGPADNLAGRSLVALFERVSEHVFFGEQLHYRPRSELHRQRIRRVREQVRAIEANRVWAGVQYQPVTLGEAIGRLRFVEGSLDPATVLPETILVLDHVPDDLPVCAGIVTSQIQAPLAHVAVLSQSRGTPNMALRGVMQGSLRELDDDIVRIRVLADDYVIEPASAEQLRVSLDARRPAPVQPPALDPVPAELTQTCRLRLADTSWAGAKAAQLGEVCAAGVPTSAGFVVPVHHYLDHLETHGIDVSTATLRSTEGFGTDGQVRARLLEERRQEITSVPVDRGLIAQLRARIRRVRGRRWIFRSSTNAEDLPGFSGAGLYDSTVTVADPDDAAIARAVLSVWASVFSRRAWDERDYYRVDHEAVAMAILVQPLVEDVVAMGVAITENPFSAQRSGILVNLAPPGSSVTAARGEELPEQILLYRHSRAEIISRSTANGGRPILAASATRALRDRLEAVHVHMMALWGSRADAADIEFALRADGSAVILQARPYRMASQVVH